MEDEFVMVRSLFVLLQQVADHLPVAVYKSHFAGERCLKQSSLCCSCSSTTDCFLLLVTQTLAEMLRWCGSVGRSHWPALYACDEEGM